MPGSPRPARSRSVVIRTTGDRVTDRPLAELGGKGLFCKELEAALLERRIDLAVHSIKDLPTWLPDGLMLAAVLPREDPRDVLIAPGGAGLDALPPGAVIGSASLRRQAQLLARRPDLRVVNLRGNVGTRLRKLEAGEVDATLLALAGLKRLALMPAGAVILPPEVMLPAVGQGAIGLECRADDSATLRRCSRRSTIRRAAPACGAERALLAALDGSCHTPIAGFAEIADGEPAPARAGRASRRQPLPARRAPRRARRGRRRSGAMPGCELRARAGPGFFD